MKIKILINVSNIYIGGGVQVALSFINELRYIENDNQYYVFLSREIAKQIEQSSFADNFYFYQIGRSPAKLRTRRQIVKKLRVLEEQIKPDVVFTVFGPSYWQPKAIHVMGFADGWAYNPKSVAFSRLSYFRRLKMRLHGLYKRYYLKRDADFYVLETADAKAKFAMIMDVDVKKIFVVGNTYSHIFKETKYLQKNSADYLKLQPKGEEFRLVYIAHNHANKNIGVINDILNLLNDDKIKFVLTLDKESYKNLFPKSPKQIINIGSIAHHLCPSVYEQCDALFAPTLLETFSASYPEAMRMEKPILTSNYSFAIDVCQDAALYFDPLDPKDITEKILMLKSNISLQDELIQKGKKRLESFETARTRAEKYLKICEKIVRNEK